MRLRLPLSCLALVLTASPALSKTATSFCKCICGTESEIIALNPDLDVTPNYAPSLRLLFDRAAFVVPKDEDDNGDSSGGSNGAKASSKSKDKENDSTQHKKTCSDCTRQFCLDYNLPKCKSIPEDDIGTQCFQRDSSKDQAVVLLFIGATASLLSWALLRPWITKLRQVNLNARDRNTYAPVAHGDGDEA